MKKKILSMIMSLSFIMSCITVTSVKAQIFYDVDDTHWAYDYIMEMVNRGVLSGYLDETFRPDNYVTRAEFAKIMTAASGLNILDVESSSFDDVDADDWYCPYIETAKYYLSGYRTAYTYLYKPNDLALREDIAVAMVKLKGYEDSAYNLSVLWDTFTDWKSISSDAQKYVAIAVERGLITGYNDQTFRGQRSITRAEAATLLWRAFQYGNDNKSFSVDYSHETAEPTFEPTVTPKPTATPTVRPTATPTVRPTATPTVKPTVKPTEAPTLKPTAKPTATPKANKLAYEIDSLGSADVEDTYLMASQDDNDNLYYYDSSDDAVYKMNMNSGKKTRILKVSSLTYEVYKDEEKEVTETVTEKVPRTVIEEVPLDEEDITSEIDENEDEEIIDENDDEADEETPSETSKPKTKQVEKTVYDEVTKEVTTTKIISVLQGRYKNYEVDQLYYNTGNDKLLLIGRFNSYKSERSHNDKSNEKAVIYEINGNNAKVYSEVNIVTSHGYYNVDGIQGNMDNGNVMYGSYSNNYIYDLSASKKIMTLNTYMHDGFFYTKGNKAYYCDDGRIYEYSFSSNNKKSLWDDAVGESAHGLNNKIYYSWDVSNGEINKIESDGEPQKLKINTLKDIEVNDFYNMPTKFSIKNKRIFITNNESFIFYDTAAAGGTWRKISKQ